MSKLNSVNLDKLANAYNSGGEFECGLLANAMGFSLDKALMEDVMDRAEILAKKETDIPHAWQSFVA